MAPIRYRYELRRGEEIVSTGHFTNERPFEVGDRAEIGGSAGIVRSIGPTLGAAELQLVVQGDSPNSTNHQ